MPRTNGKRTRRILRLCIENGHLDHWTTSANLLHIITSGYGTDKFGNNLRWVDMTTNQLAVCLGQLERYGEVEQNRTAGKISRWRKV